MGLIFEVSLVLYFQFPFSDINTKIAGMEESFHAFNFSKEVCCLRVLASKVHTMLI